uniref:NEDD4 binding protein 2 n=1 Tax=Aquila chrysaetos chrysaetos TaxID=223781 RepID=A0A663DKJ3_AQUCH
MPRRRKTGGSPSRKNGNSDRTAVAVSQGDPSRSMSQAVHSVNKEELFNSMSEMFSDLDPSVVYMVLSECDFKVENAMDYLLELSTHAKGVASSKTLGFDSVASSLALVNQQRSAANGRMGESTAEKKLDSLIENAFQRYSLSDELPNSANDQIVPKHSVEHDGFNEFPEREKSDSGCNVLLFPQQAGTNDEVLENCCCSQPPVSQLSFQTSSPAALDTFGQILEDSDLSEMHVQHDLASEVYKQLNGEIACGNSDQTQDTGLDQKNVTAVSGESSQRPLELGVAVTGNPNSRCVEQHKEAVTAFNSHQSTSLPEVYVSLETSSFKTPKPADLQQTQQGYNLNFSTPSCQPQQHWNLMAPVFYPSSGSHSFVTPVAVSPGQWRPVSDYRTLEKGLFFPSPVVSNAWDSNPSLKVWGNQDRNSKLNLSQAQQPPVCHMMRKKMHLIGQVLVLLRGVPGSGKSYLARTLLEDNPGGIILSTDDYFYKHGQYHYDANCLGEAHDWNRKRAKEAFEMRISPIIVDNTNIQAWEMKPYVALAQQFKYKVMFREPDTWWKFKPKELERRNIHGVSKEKIKRMLERYEHCLTVSSILDSSVPDKSEAAGWIEDPCQEESHRLDPFSSFVDVTTTEETLCLHTGGVGEHGDNNILKVQTEVEQSGKICMEPKSTQSSNVVEPSSSAFDMSGKPELLNFLGDWPVEQTMGQRVKRARRLEKSSLKSDKEGKTPSKQHSELGKEQAGLPGTCTVEKGHEEENLASSCSSVSSDKVTLELQMIGHWPASGSLEQRQQRSRRTRKTSLNQSDEGRNTEGDINRSALETVDVLRGTPVNTAEQPDAKSLHMHQPETVASEAVGEKKPQQNKRMRKHHKLALTFTNNNLPHPKEEHFSVLNSAEEKQDIRSGRQKSNHSQTESQDFALLWRLEKKMLFPETTKVLHGRLDGFKPKDVDNVSESQEKIPYRVTYDKSTFVEESELSNIDESEKLNMLCKLFESVSFEALKDLYERCNKDIDWATGLLLDSDEKLCKDVDTECFHVREAEPVVADLDFKASTNYGENLKDCEQMPQIIGTGDISEPSEDKNSSLNAAPRTDAGSSAASIELSISGKQKVESESPAEETINKPSVSQLDAGFCIPMTFNAENSKVSALLLEMDHAPLVDPRSDKELEMDKETQGSSRETRGKEEIETPSIHEAKVKIQSPIPASRAAFNIDCLELTLPPELALQLKEIFGPVGIDAGSLTVEDCVVHIDLNLAKVIHEKWKESILVSRFLQIDTDDSEMLLSHNTRKPATSDVFPFMDHWNAQIQKVSLRQIISEEIAIQEKQDLNRVPSMVRKDCAAKLKEKQLFEMFPTMNQNFLMDVFKDNNYSLEQTEQFLNCVLEADPVKTVIAQDSVQQNEIVSSYSAAKNREKKAKKSKEEDDPLSEKFQEFEYPQYDDLRAEAFCHQQKRQECLKKAGEAYRMGMKPVAAFYAHQGRLHEQKMKEANHAAAVQIFEKVNTSLLPMNVLDLHGLHVDEAVNQLSRVLQEKSEAYQQTGGKPYLCVITGRGSHSQGGVARIRPAAIRYLTSHNFRFTEIKPGCLKVMLN